VKGILLLKNNNSLVHQAKIGYNMAEGCSQLAAFSHSKGTRDATYLKEICSKLLFIASTTS